MSPSLHEVVGLEKSGPTSRFLQIDINVVIEHTFTNILLPGDTLQYFLYHDDIILQF